MYTIYWIINENFTKTYIGFTNDIKLRIHYHKSNKVRTSENFGKFRIFALEKVNALEDARNREKYWKSCAGRKKLKIYFKKIKNMPPSSSG